MYTFFMFSEVIGWYSRWDWYSVTKVQEFLMYPAQQPRVLFREEVKYQKRHPKVWNTNTPINTVFPQSWEGFWHSLIMMDSGRLLWKMSPEDEGRLLGKRKRLQNTCLNSCWQWTWPRWQETSISNSVSSPFQLLLEPVTLWFQGPVPRTIRWRELSYFFRAGLPGHFLPKLLLKIYFKCNVYHGTLKISFLKYFAKHMSVPFNL